MKINFLLLLFAVFSLSNSTTNETEIKDSFNNEKSATSESLNNWDKFTIRVRYNSNLSVYRRDLILNHYFRKYHNEHSTDRLRGTIDSEFVNEEIWHGIKSIDRPEPGLDDDIETEIGDDPDIEIP